MYGSESLSPRKEIAEKEREDDSHESDHDEENLNAQDECIAKRKGKEKNWYRPNTEIVWLAYGMRIACN